MPFPIVYPKQDGPGRLLELCTFRKSSLPDKEWNEIFYDTTGISLTFPISRQSLYASQIEDPQIAVLIADWTSAEEKDIFEPSERYQSIKPAFGKLIDTTNPSFTCHHLILPGAAKTPASPFLSASHIRIPAKKQDAAAVAFEEYLSSGTALDGLEYLVVAPSREDANTIVCIVGTRDPEAAKAVGATLEHDKLKDALDALKESGSKYMAKVISAKDANPQALPAP
ncbi:hypothetical protein SAPIO_CDS8787 [Scedosporium apiospermum]|uniref:ABM domain-containing protein n=1 Tax=Pseudallescheria apiosperma TaxID=563466 RepID=A0A084FXN7_PSEDA|nr:uncharacterized protein SAPIO_CDS8787 [Scedosporium apiospermum]KEZ39849.1 hypothetical protein SAPIO_CDS8787 [Scedosporium apiospermum]